MRVWGNNVEYNAFSEGVRPGGVTTSHQIIILICYMAAEAGEPVTLEQLRTALLRQELVNYFEFANAAEFMVKSGHLVPVEGQGEQLYSLSELGRKTADTFETELPASVRDRATGALRNILTLLRRQRENKVEITKTSDGYLLSLSIPDIGTDLLGIQVFLPTIEECEAVRRRFLNDPLIVYKGVLALLTGDMETVGELLPSQENLFEE